MRFIPFALLAVLSIPAFSQDAEAPAVEATSTAPKVKERPDGWKFGINIGVLTDWKYDLAFPGKQDGHSLNVGGRLGGTASWFHGDMEWRNSLTLALAYNKTPLLDVFVKSSDDLNLASTFYWTFGGWWGAYGQLNYDTSMLPGYDQQRTPVTYSVDPNVGPVFTVPNAIDFKLTSPFLPSTLREALGLFARPLTLGYFDWEVKAGGYARQAFSDGTYRIRGKTGTTVNVVENTTFYDIGPLAGTNVKGVIVPKKFFYSAGVEAGYAAWVGIEAPITNNFVDRIWMDAQAQLTYKPFEWVALTWSGKAAYFTAVADGMQLDTHLMLNFPITL